MTTTSTSTSTTTTEDVRLLESVELQVGVEAIPIRIGKCNLWVGWEPGIGMKSWKVYYAEKPYTDYILVADFKTNPELFTVNNHIRVLTETGLEAEARVLIQNVTAGRQYKAKVYAYNTSTQETVDMYGISREVYAPILSDDQYLQVVAKVVE